MSSKTTDKRLRTRIPHAHLAVAVCGLLVALVAGTAFASLPEQGKRPPQLAVTLGNTKTSPDPLCPQRPPERQKPDPTQIKRGCQAVGSVTGFQLKADGRKQLFRAPHNARIVAWAVSAANTNKLEENAFGSRRLFFSPRFGSEPQAQLAVLKKLKHRGGRFRLVRNSPVENLTGAQGHKQYFTLGKPLRIKKGMIVGITVPTWAPILATGTATDNAWRASRDPKKCGGATPEEQTQNAVSARPQLNKKSVRKYGCTFTGTRLLYWAYYVRGLGGGR